MIRRKELNEIFDQLRPLREEKRIEGQDPPSVLFLKDKIKESNDPDKISSLRELLRAEYINHEMDKEHEELLRENVKIYKGSFDEAVSLITLAKYLGQSNKNKKEAISLMRKAIEQSKEYNYLGYFYNELARFAIILRDYAMLNEAINFLIEHDMEKDSITLPYDISFLKDIPEEALDPSLLNAFIEKAEKFNQYRKDQFLAKRAEKEAMEGEN